MIQRVEQGLKLVVRQQGFSVMRADGRALLVTLYA